MHSDRHITATSDCAVYGDDPGVQSPDRSMTRPDVGPVPRPARGRPGHRPATCSMRRAPARSAGPAIRRVAMSLSYNPTPSTPLGFVARVAPSWGGQATSGAEALWGRETMAGMAHGGLAQGTRLDGEVGYGLAVGRRFVGTPTLGVGTSADGRDYRLGYRLGALGGAGTAFELGVDAQRRERPLQGDTDHAALARATLRW